MKKPGKPNFEDAWRDAFEEAELAPSAQLWANLDQHLNQTEIALLRRRVFYWRAAAASLLLFLGLGFSGWYYYDSQDNTRGNGGIAVNQTVQEDHQTRPSETLNAPSATKAAPSLAEQSGSAVAPAYQGTVGSATPEAGSENRLAESATDQPTSQVLSDKNDTSQEGREKSSVRNSDAVGESTVANQYTKRRLLHTGRETELVGGGIINQDVLNEKVATTQPANQPNAVISKESGGYTTQNANPDQHASVMQELNARSVQNQSVAVNLPRYLRTPRSSATLFDLLPDEKEVSKGGTTWASISFAPSYFNPNVNSDYQNSVANSMLFADRSAGLASLNPTAEERISPNFSYQFNVKAGKDLSKRWSVQSGLTYLFGNTSLHTTTVTSNTLTNATRPLLAAALENLPTPDIQNTTFQNVGYAKDYNTFSSTSEQLQNEYQFLSIPLQASFTFLPDKKINISPAAGFSADFLLLNRISGSSNSQIQTVELTPGKNSGYRDIGFSGLVGLMFQYTYSEHLDLLIEPSYRSALFSITKSTSSVRSTPNSLGLGLGLKYRF